MMWKLQYRYKLKAQDEFVDEWEDVLSLDSSRPLKHFSGVTEAFEYLFGAYGYQRAPYKFDYQLTPVFATKPIPVEFEPWQPELELSGTFRIRTRGLAQQWRK